jgi:hypothetical protein
MSTQPAANQVAVPAHIMARQQARKASESKSSLISAVVSDGFAFPKVSIRASRYRLVEDGVETPVGITLDVIIVGVSPNISKVFYAKPFDGNLDVRPDCFSNDGVRPDSSVQAPIASSCASCPHNVLGSKMNPSGAKSKLCGDQRHLGVVAAADPTKVYALTVPVSGMKNLREYFKHLQNYGLSPEEVITELGFDESANFPKITFRHKGYVPEKGMTRVDEIVASDEVKEVIRLIPPRDRSAALAAPEAQAAITQQAAPAPAAPAVDEAYEEEDTSVAGIVAEQPAVVQEAAVQATVVQEQPVVKPKVKATNPAPVAQAAAADAGGVAGLEAKLDDLFGE